MRNGVRQLLLIVGLGVVNTAGAVDLVGTWSCEAVDLTFLADGSSFFYRKGEQPFLVYGGWRVHGGNLVRTVTGRREPLDQPWQAASKSGNVNDGDAKAVAEVYELKDLGADRISLRHFARINFDGASRREMRVEPAVCTKVASPPEVAEWRASVPRALMDGVPGWPKIATAQLARASDAGALSAQETQLAVKRAAIGNQCSYPTDRTAAESELLMYRQRAIAAAAAAKRGSAQCSGYGNIASDQLSRTDNSFNQMAANAQSLPDKHVPVNLLHSLCDTYSAVLRMIPNTCR